MRHHNTQLPSSFETRKPTTMHHQRGELGIIKVILMAILLVLLPVALASPSLSPPSSSLAGLSSRLEIESIKNTINSHESTVIEKRQMSAGSSCDGSEGQWNCLTNQWQRCASGQWSVVMDCAAGTMCTPSGLTYDFAVQFANGAAGGPATSGSSSGAGTDSIRWILLAVLGGVGIINAMAAR
ncbi:hypothetical protein F5Y04DRAFT_261065 [Hypomontagnella monticulosa]|nr:hypothetical protein F5Y04DRAFT_261065 [Hypomontagnella monticulosa]